jgi:hypothetical protein
LENDEKSESSAERKEPSDEALERDRMSGAFRAWTLVVERSSVGNEIFEREMVPAAYLKEESDWPEGASYWRFARLVNALASDMVDEAIFSVQAVLKMSLFLQYLRSRCGYPVMLRNGDPASEADLCP